MTACIMLREIGNFGYKGKYPDIKTSEIPKTEPFKIVEEPTFPQ
jgi:hypothetical protein